MYIAWITLHVIKVGSNWNSNFKYKYTYMALHIFRFILFSIPFRFPFHFPFCVLVTPSLWTQRLPLSFCVYLWEASRISGALYQRVATYSVRFGSPVSASTPIWVRERASPKSQTFTTHSLSSKILEGYNGKCFNQISTQERTKIRLCLLFNPFMKDV